MRKKRKRLKQTIIWIISLIGLLSYGQAIWAKDISMSVSTGIQELYKAERYIPVHVTINNEGSNFLGRIQIVIGNSGLEYSQTVNIVAGASQDYIVPIKNVDDYYDKATIKLLNQEEQEIDKNYIYMNSRMLDEDDLVIGILADDAAALNYFNKMDLRFNNSYQTYTVNMEKRNIDGNVKNLDMLDMIIINDYNTSELLPEQLDALKDWVNQGGVLVIGTGINGNKTLSGLAQEVIPVSFRGTTVEEVSLSTPTSVIEETISLDLAQLEISGVELEDDLGYKTLYDAWRMGAGKVIVAKCDLGLEPMASWSYNADLWKQIFYGEINGIEEIENDRYYWTSGLERVSSKNLPSYKFLVGILAGYIVVMGIVSYFVLKKKNKKEYIWLVAPILSIGITVVIYSLSMGSRLAPYIVNQLEVIEVGKRNDAKQTTFMTVLNTQGKDLNVAETEEIQFKQLGDSARYYSDEIEKEITQHIEYVEGKLNYQQTGNSVYDTTLFVLESQQVEIPQYKVAASMVNGNYEVDFENNSNQKIKYLFAIDNDQIWDLGVVEANQTVSHILSTQDAKWVYDMIDEYTTDEEVADIGMILRFVENMNRDQYAILPRYLVIMENQEDVLSIVQGQYDSDFNYSIIIGNMQMAINGQDYPYDYFAPVAVSQQGLGYLETYTPIMTITDDLEVELDYPIEDIADIVSVTIGFNEEVMSQNYYSALNGEIYIYNYETDTYELLDIGLGEEYTIGEAALKDYFRNQSIRLKIVGVNEDCGLVPSIKVGGTSDAAN